MLLFQFFMKNKTSKFLIIKKVKELSENQSFKQSENQILFKFNKTNFIKYVI